MKTPAHYPKPKASAKPPKGAKPVARITVYAVPKKGTGRKK